MSPVWLLAIVVGLGPSGSSPEDLPPGGYWKLGERRAPEPDDGHDNLMIGGIMAALGLWRTASGAVQVYISTPDRCADLGRYRIDPDSCPQLRGYGWAGVAFGAAFVLTGVTMLAIGGAQRQRHRAWQRRYGKAARRPVPEVDGAGLVLRF